MSLIFGPKSNEEAFDNIKSGAYKIEMLKYLKEDNGQIVWGIEEKFVDSVTIYSLFELDTPDEYVNFKEMSSLDPSPLVSEFKNTIKEAYELFLEWQKIQQIKELLLNITQLNDLYASSDNGFCFNYDKVIEHLTTARNEIDNSLKCRRPSDLPENVAWSENTDPNSEFDPVVFDGSMSLKDFETAQNNYFKHKKI